MTLLTLKIGGALLDDKHAVATLADEIRALQDADVRLCIVHGGGPQITQALALAGIPEHRVDGLRVTPPEAAAIVQREMDAIGLELAATLTRAGVQVYHVPSTSGRLRARPKGPVDGVDLGRVGTVQGFDGLGIPGAVGGPVPVITPVGTDGTGPLNVNADEGACAIATSVGSDALVLLTNVPAVLDEHGQPIKRLGPERAKALLSAGVARDGMVPKLTSALWALQHGVPQVLITDLAPGSLSSAMSRDPHGTKVLSTAEVVA